MRLRDLIRLVFSNLNRMRGRALMTSLGVMIGTAAIVVLIALAAGLQKSTTGSFSDFGPLNQITVMSGAAMRFGPDEQSGPGEEALLTPRQLDEFREMPGVTAVTPYVNVQAGSVQLNRLIGFPSMVGIDQHQMEAMGLVPAEGTLQMGRWTAIVGSRVGENFLDAKFNELDEPVDLYGQTIVLKLERVDEEGEVFKRTLRIRIAGVLEERGGQEDTTMFLTLDDATEINEWMRGERINYNRDGYDQAIVVVDDPELAIQVENQLLLEGFFAFSARSILQQVNILFTVVQAVFGGIGAIALLVAAIGIANTMVMSILERTREIGLMKAVGASNRDVMSVFIAEAGALGIFGGIGGVVFGIGAAQLINLIAVAYINGQIAASGSPNEDPINIVFVPIWLPLFAIGFSLVIGLASGIYPALRAVQLNPVSALKYE